MPKKVVGFKCPLPYQGGCHIVTPACFGRIEAARILNYINENYHHVGFSPPMRWPFRGW